ncbi:MAG: hypothetical protein WDW38_005397 [Sanguina aurantia]
MAFAIASRKAASSVVCAAAKKTKIAAAALLSANNALPAIERLIKAGAQIARAMPAAVSIDTFLHSREPTLKEWAVAIAALGSGDQTVLFRKGGIREPCFKPSAREFLLFPTAFHSEQQLLKEGVAERYEEAFALDPRANPTLPLTVHATITGAWTTFDLRVLQILDPLHVHSEAFRETRLKWRGAQPITILELRALRLEPQLVLNLREEHFGCFSWVDLASDLSLPLALESATSALDDAAFSQRQHILRELLLQVEVTELHF